MNTSSQNATPSILPPGIEQQTFHHALVYSRAWRQHRNWTLLPIGLILIGLCAAVFLTTRTSASSTSSHFLPIAVTVGTGLYLYAALVQLLNRTRIHLSDFGVLVTHGPFPWKAETCLELNQIQRVFLKEVPTRGEGANVMFHHVWVENTQGKSLALISGDLPEFQASYLRDQIQNFLDRTQVQLSAGESGSELTLSNAA